MEEVLINTGDGKVLAMGGVTALVGLYERNDPVPAHALIFPIMGY